LKVATEKSGRGSYDSASGKQEGRKNYSRSGGLGLLAPHSSRCTCWFSAARSEIQLALCFPGFGLTLGFEAFFWVVVEDRRRAGFTDVDTASAAGAAFVGRRFRSGFGEGAPGPG